MLETIEGILPQRTHSALCCLTLLVSVFLTTPGKGAEQCPQREGIVISGKVNVTASCECYGLADGAEGPYKTYGCDIFVERNGSKFRSGVTMRTGRWTAEDPIIYIRKLTRWRDGFLFVPFGGGCGTMWPCWWDHVFTVRDGELLCIGSITGFGKPDGQWVLFEDGLFYDVTGFRTYGLTCHANAPRFGRVMTEQNGIFVADLGRTWDLNEDRYNKCLADIDRYLREDGGKRSSYLGVMECLLHNGGLARYCDRERELEEMLSQAERMLSAQDFQKFRRSVYSVVPADTPDCAAAELPSDRIGFLPPILDDGIERTTSER